MRAITIRQPWTTLVADGIKTVENRTAGTQRRGPLAIHAGLARDPQGDVDPRVRAVLDPIRYDQRRDHTTGAVIAVAQLVDVHVAARDGSCCPPWGDGWLGPRPTVHLVLADPVRLAEPIPARGFLGLWTWHDAPADLVEPPGRRTP